MEKLNENQVQNKLSDIGGWNHNNGYITKTYTFKNFKETFAIMARIAFECEAQGHHPNWENVYNTLVIKLNTHDVDGITQKDFDLAKTIEGIINS